jgi:hypothetical protein
MNNENGQMEIVAVDANRESVGVLITRRGYHRPDQPKHAAGRGLDRRCTWSSWIQQFGCPAEHVAVRR